jgi:hypothetical protein
VEHFINICLQGYASSRTDPEEPRSTNFAAASDSVGRKQRRLSIVLDKRALAIILEVYFDDATVSVK